MCKVWSLSHDNPSPPSPPPLKPPATAYIDAYLDLTDTTALINKITKYSKIFLFLSEIFHRTATEFLEFRKRQITY